MGEKLKAYIGNASAKTEEDLQFSIEQALNKRYNTQYILVDLYCYCRGEDNPYDVCVYGKTYGNHSYCMFCNLPPKCAREHFSKLQRGSDAAKDRWITLTFGDWYALSGWECEVSVNPLGRCVNYVGYEETKNPVNLSEYVYPECCIYCGEPDERK